MSTASPPPPSALAAALADRYTIERELGAGGMATVYLALDLKHHRKVALKVLRPDLSATMGPERFVREVTIAANLQHPHILPLYDSGEAAGFLYYVMPFVEGQTLRDRLHRERELPVADAVRILRDVTDAMATAHAKGVVHRDLKPENIMLSGRHALVADFGVAKAVSEATGRNTLTTAGVALGTPTYMAPEQATADPLTDHRADLYALGVIAYEVLTGQPPFVRGTPQAMLAAHVTEAPKAVTEQRASIPAPLAAIVMRCLEKKPADRPQDAEELLAVLETLMTSSGGMTPTDTRPVQAVTAAPVASLKWKRAVVAVSAVAVLAVAGWLARDLRGPKVDPRVRSPMVVVPFEVRASDPSLKSIGLDAAERISGALQQAGFGEVVPYSGDGGDATFTPACARKVARESKAATLVFGTVSQRGGDVEFEARVVRAADQRIIWSLGPERSAVANPGVAMDAIKERVLGAAGAYLSSLSEGSVNPGLYQPPGNLEAARLMIKADELFRASRYRQVVPLLHAVAGADPAYTAAPLSLVGAYSNIGGSWPQLDSLLRAVEARREQLMPGDALRLDYSLTLHASPEQEYRAMQASYASDSVPLMYLAMWSSVRARRPREALRYFAMRDSTAAWGRDWQAWFTFAAFAHHMLGEYDAELSLAKSANSREPGAIGHWHSMIRALAAMKRFDEIDGLITTSHSLEVPAAPVWLMNTAMLEARLHGADSAARRYATRSLAALDQQSDSIKGTIAGRNALRSALRTLGDQKAVVAAYDEELRMQGNRGLGNRILAMRDRVLMGDTAGALALVKSVREQPMSSFAGSAWNVKGAPRYYAAQILALLGKKDEAVALLRDALNNGWRIFGDEERQWFWAPIKDYPPFLELMKVR